MLMFLRDQGSIGIRKADTPALPASNFLMKHHDISRLTHARSRKSEACAFAAASQTAVDILDAMGEAILLLNMDGRVKSVNPALEKMTSIPACEVIGQTVHSFLPGILPSEEYKAVETAIEDLLRGQIPSLPRLTLVSRSGRLTPVLPAASYVFGSDGRPAAAVISLRDISTLQAAQESLKNSEKKYRELVELANSIIIRVTPDHDITFFNEFA